MTGLHCYRRANRHILRAWMTLPFCIPFFGSLLGLCAACTGPTPTLIDSADSSIDAAATGSGDGDGDVRDELADDAGLETDEPACKVGRYEGKFNCVYTDYPDGGAPLSGAGDTAVEGSIKLTLQEPEAGE